MYTTPTFSRPAPLIGALALCLVIQMTLVTPAHAQVTVEMEHAHVTIVHADHTLQQVFKPEGMTGRWVVADNAGNLYETGGYQGGGDSSDDDVIVVGGYQSGGDSSDDDVIVVGGYQGALHHLEDNYGAVIERDATLGVDLVAFPGDPDPYTTFFNAIVNDSLHGHPLVDFFRLIELTSQGVFHEPSYTTAAPPATPYPFPDDVYYGNQWNLAATELAKAPWLPVAPRQPARIAIIDSGIGSSHRNHEGLDGVVVHHEDVAPTTGFPMPHALGLITLLGDRNADGSGITSLLGPWNSGDGCYGRPALTSLMPPAIYSYNVGDFGPSSIHVARAIQGSIAQEVDIINLSLRLAYSPIVEQAIQDALAHNIIVVAAAGNYAADALNKPTTFPADMDGVIAVGGAGHDQRITATSANQGIDILAPGADVIAGAPGNIWYRASGTSFAAPHVTATLALMRTVQPGLTPAAALTALQQGATYLDGSRVGFLNAGGALNQILPSGAQVDWNRIPLPHACAGGFNKAADATEAVPAFDGFADAPLALPAEPALEANYPNPFNPETTIRFALPEGQRVRLAVYNALGQQVQVLADGVLPGGRHEVRFRAHGLPSGTYFARLSTAAGVQMRSMILTK